ncbi:MAG: hypothetical protein HC904_08000 [Blastochloris sp.]|nr:hypothetical protein [Blastochloris sp.]
MKMEFWWSQIETIGRGLLFWQLLAFVLCCVGLWLSKRWSKQSSAIGVLVLRVTLIGVLLVPLVLLIPKSQEQGAIDGSILGSEISFPSSPVNWQMIVVSIPTLANDASIGFVPQKLWGLKDFNVEHVFL